MAPGPADHSGLRRDDRYGQPVDMSLLHEPPTEKILLDQPHFLRVPDQFGVRTRRQLFHGIPLLPARGLGADLQQKCDLVIGMTRGKETNYLDFFWGQA